MLVKKEINHFRLQWSLGVTFCVELKEVTSKVCSAIQSLKCALPYLITIVTMATKMLQNLIKHTVHLNVIRFPASQILKVKLLLMYVMYFFVLRSN